MKIWIVWLPNVGKSTLFNALTNTYAADAANFPFCTIEPNVGVVEVRDPRLYELARQSQSAKIIPATIDFVDIAWLVKGASQGQGMGNAFLGNIKNVDAIVHVVRHFADERIIHVNGRVDARADAETICTELMLADLDQVEKKIWQLTPKAKSGDATIKKNLSCLTQIKEHLTNGIWLHDILSTLDEDDRSFINTLHLLSAKPMIYAINVWLDDLPRHKEIKAQYDEQLGTCCIVCAALEAEMIGMQADEKQSFVLDAVGDTTAPLPTLDTLIATAFDAVGLMYYFTTWPQETRAWTIPKWSSAPKAAGKIHQDFEKKFIRAEVIAYSDLAHYGSWTKAKEAGKLRIEGKEYIVQDGDVMYFRIGG